MHHSLRFQQKALSMLKCWTHNPKPDNPSEQIPEEIRPNSNADPRRWTYWDWPTEANLKRGRGRLISKFGTRGRGRGSSRGRGRGRGGRGGRGSSRSRGRGRGRGGRGQLTSFRGRGRGRSHGRRGDSRGRGRGQAKPPRGSNSLLDRLNAGY
ncbi:hypothetical protein Pelo_243 [Pelomyxa schiedti]|nr:hypothetical protein Pelo_243 [Pelomyxa schiedti]